MAAVRVLQSPYYFHYETWPGHVGLTFNATPPGPRDDNSSRIEILNVPANPTGAIRQPAVMRPRQLICDMVFNWRTYKTGGDPIDCDIQVGTTVTHLSARWLGLD